MQSEATRVITRDSLAWPEPDGREGERVLSADAILRVVLGAVVRRLSRRGMSGESRRTRYTSSAVEAFVLEMAQDG